MTLLSIFPKQNYLCYLFGILKIQYCLASTMVRPKFHYLSLTLVNLCINRNHLVKLSICSWELGVFPPNFEKCGIKNTDLRKDSEADKLVQSTPSRVDMLGTNSDCLP